RIRSNYDADDQRQREPMQNLSSKNIEGEHRQERQSGGQDSSAQRLVDRFIDDIGQAVSPKQLDVLANTIEDDNRIVHRISDERQDRGDHRQRHLDVQYRE